MLAHVVHLARPVRDVSLHDLPRCLGLTPLFPLLPQHNHASFAAAFAMAAVGLVTAVAASLSSSPSPLSVLLFMKADLLMQAHLKAPALGALCMRGCRASAWP
jgi:hypothetical protein